LEKKSLKKLRKLVLSIQLQKQHHHIINLYAMFLSRLDLTTYLEAVVIVIIW